MFLTTSMTAASVYHTSCVLDFMLNISLIAAWKITLPPNMALHVFGYLWPLSRPASGSDPVEPRFRGQLDDGHSSKGSIRILAKAATNIGIHYLASRGTLYTTVRSVRSSVTPWTLRTFFKVTVFPSTVVAVLAVCESSCRYEVLSL